MITVTNCRVKFQINKQLISLIGQSNTIWRGGHCLQCCGNDPFFPAPALIKKRRLLTFKTILYNNHPHTQQKKFKDLFLILFDFNLNFINVRTEEDTSIQNFFFPSKPEPALQTGSGHNVSAPQHWFLSVKKLMILSLTANENEPPSVIVYQGPFTNSKVKSFYLSPGVRSRLLPPLLGRSRSRFFCWPELKAPPAASFWQAKKESFVLVTNIT